MTQQAHSNDLRYAAVRAACASWCLTLCSLRSWMAIGPPPAVVRARPGQLQFLQHCEGAFFVLASAAMLFLLMHSELRARWKAEGEARTCSLANRRQEPWAESASRARG